MNNEPVSPNRPRPAEFERLGQDAGLEIGDKCLLLHALHFCLNRSRPGSGASSHASVREDVPNRFLARIHLEMKRDCTEHGLLDIKRGSV